MVELSRLPDDGDVLVADLPLHGQEVEEDVTLLDDRVWPLTQFQFCLRTIDNNVLPPNTVEQSCMQFCLIAKILKLRFKNNQKSLA